MTSVLLHARADLRARWSRWLGVALLIAVVGGAVIALGAGARRTDTAYARFLRAERAADVELFVGTDPGLPTPSQIEGLPQVAASAGVLSLPAAEPDLVPAVATDGRYGRDVNRFKFLAGRPLRADRADESVVGFLLAERRHLHVGSPLTIHVVPGAPSTVTLRVVGIEAAPTEFPPRTATDTLTAYLSPAFLDTPLGAEAMAGPGTNHFLALRLHGGARDAAPLLTSVQQLTGGPVGSTTLTDQTANVERSMRLQAVALWLMAGFTSVVGAVVLLQLLTRQGFEDAEDYPTLGALGMTPSQLAASGMARVLVTATAGAVAAGVLAWVASPLLPLGTARIAEPHPGLAFDAAAISAGLAGLVALVAFVGAVAQLRTAPRGAHRRLRADETATPSSSLGKVLSLARLPLALGIGARLALQRGRGRTAVPVRTTLTATAVGIGALAAAVTFGASLSHLLDTPQLYGVTYDAHVMGSDMFADVRPAVPVVQSDPDVSAFAIGSTGGTMQAGKVTFGAQATTSTGGSIEPTVIEGRLPTAPDEILLGSKTMRDLHTGLGRTVSVAITDVTGPMPLRVVGRGVLPPIDATEQLGRGAVVSPSLVERLDAAAPPGFTVPPPGDVFVRFRPGRDHDHARADLRSRLGTADFMVRAPVQPTGVADFGQVRNLPEILAGLFGVMGLVTIVHLLVSAIRRRRRDLAVLKALGLPPSKVSAAIFWQATTVGVVSAALGLPLGVVAGRWVWNLVALQLGVLPQPQVPLGVLAGLTIAVLVVVNVVAAGPAMMAGRVEPASVLRTE